MEAFSIGAQISNLTVISLPWKELYPDGRTHWTYKCLCVCGNICERSSAYLRDTAKTKSCGCLQYAHTTKHNSHTTRLYSIWENMRTRCYCKAHKSFKNYGDRGIRVDPAWDDFIVFKAWAEEHGYTDNLTIDRIDNDKDYAPTNCRFISREENTRRAHLGKAKYRQRVRCRETGQEFNDAFEIPETLRVNAWSPSIKSVYHALSTGAALCGKHFDFIKE